MNILLASLLAGLWASLGMALTVIAAGPGASGNTTVLGIDDTRFTLNGHPTFLLGFSYYGGLGASAEFLRRDLDEFERRDFNWLRVWATWNVHDYDVSAVSADGQPREPFLARLGQLVAECDRRGMVVDVTLSRGKNLPDFEAHQRAIEVLVNFLKPYRNWYLDLGNERDVRDARYVSPEELKRLRETVHQFDPRRLVTASFGGHDLSAQDIRESLMTAGVDFLAPHRPRSADSPRQTESRTRECLAMAKEIARAVPVHHQEPFRRGYGRWEPRAEDFLKDLRGAVAGNAAGWCFHNGSQRDGTDQQPRRSFDLREKPLIDQLDAEERAFIDQAGTAAAGAPYPRSRVISRLVWDDRIVKVGSGTGDNWPITREAGDFQTTAWGDGPGFDQKPPRLSLGFARIFGDPPEVRGEDFVSDADTLEGGGSKAIKASGLLAVNGTLYLFVRNYRPTVSDNFTNARLAWSKDRGTNWTWAEWYFSDTFGCPEFLQFGPDYAGARDEYVYVVSQANDSAYGYSPDIVMARVPKDQIADRARYEFHAGRNEQNQPKWSSDIARRQPIFTDPKGTQRVAITYNAGLKRYILTTSHRPLDSKATHTAALGIFDAPEPWGPWTTVYYNSHWSGDHRTYHHKFPTRWMSADGRTMWLLYSGLDGGLYTFCLKKSLLESQVR